LYKEHCSHCTILLSTTGVKYNYKLFTKIQSTINIPVDVFRKTKSPVAEELDDSSCELSNNKLYNLKTIQQLSNIINDNMEH